MRATEIEALVAAYGTPKHIVAAQVTIVIRSERGIIDHKIWFTEDFETMDEFTDEILDYCVQHGVKKINIVNEPLSEAELKELCPHCGERTVRVPWPEAE